MNYQNRISREIAKYNHDKQNYDKCCTCNFWCVVQNDGFSIGNYSLAWVEIWWWFQVFFTSSSSLCISDEKQNRIHRLLIKTNAISFDISHKNCVIFLSHFKKDCCTHISFSLPISNELNEARTRKKSIQQLVNRLRNILHHASILFKEDQ